MEFSKNKLEFFGGRQIFVVLLPELTEDWRLGDGLEANYLPPSSGVVNLQEQKHRADWQESNQKVWSDRGDDHQGAEDDAQATQKVFKLSRNFPVNDIEV